VAASRGSPVVVDRRRITLIEPGVPTQPYHHDTVGMPRREAERLVVRVRDSVMRTTLAGLIGLRDGLQPTYTIVAMTLRAPTLPYVPVTVAEAHASAAVMYRADGLLYHDALCTAARRLRLAVEFHERGTEAALAAERLGVTLEQLDRFLELAGGNLGPPWRKEHRLAAAAAMAALADRARVALPGDVSGRGRRARPGGRI
jgi:hypothetical protein